jgi:hypothetical protein
MEHPRSIMANQKAMEAVVEAIIMVSIEAAVEDLEEVVVEEAHMEEVITIEIRTRL